MNRVQLMGNVGISPSFHTFADGNRVCSFSFATNKYWKDKSSGEKTSETEWHNIKVNNQFIINMIESSIEKGDHLYIEGSLKTRTFHGKNGESKITEVCIEKYNGVITLLNKKKELMTVSYHIDDADDYF